LYSELMFFAALFAMYFTSRSVSMRQGQPWPEAHLDVPFATFNTTVLVLSSVTCQLGVWAVERGDVKKLRFWYIVSFLMGAFFIGGQLCEYSKLASQGQVVSHTPFGSVFYLTT